MTPTVAVQHCRTAVDARDIVDMKAIYGSDHNAAEIEISYFFLNQNYDVEKLSSYFLHQRT